MSAPRLLALVALCTLIVACDLRGNGSDGGTGGGDGGTDGGPAPTVRVATLNVRLFFDTVCDSGECTSSDFEQVPSQLELDQRADEVASALRTLAPSVALLQEIENEDAFDAIHSRLSDRFPYGVFGESGGFASLDVAVLSRFPVVGSLRHGEVPLERPDGSATSFTREFLEVHLDAEGYRVIVFAAHFRSKWFDDPGRRVAEAIGAEAIVSAAAAAHPDALVVFGGDLNDTPDSDALQAIERSGDFLRVAGELAPEDTTFDYRGTLYALDHLYLQTAASGRYVAGSARVVRDSPRGFGGSDHAAVRADFVPGP